MQWIELVGLLAAGLVSGLWATRLWRIAETAPQLPLSTAIVESEVSASSQSKFLSSLPSLSVIIPAYNEAENIRACVLSVLKSSDLPTDRLQVWVVDDQSTDATLAIGQSLQLELNDPRLQVLPGAARPSGETWMGKNWACTQGAERAAGDCLLFLDADVRLKSGGLETALEALQQGAVDLLTVCPAVECGCWGEWLVQPLMVALLLSGFDFQDVNDPNSEIAFATGPFMLFRRSAYEKLGGHRSVAAEVVEDVELARRVKRQGLKLRYVPGVALASVRMYRSLAGVWEGWTKNWHLGSQRQLSSSLFSAGLVFLVFTVPWLGLLGLLTQVLTQPLAALNWLDATTGSVAIAGIVFQYLIRQAINRVTATPPRYWWLAGISGVLVAAIAIVSIIKTETGWGWTWRGRSLQLPQQNS